MRRAPPVGQRFVTRAFINALDQTSAPRITGTRQVDGYWCQLRIASWSRFGPCKPTGEFVVAGTLREVPDERRMPVLDGISWLDLADVRIVESSPTAPLDLCW